MCGAVSMASGRAPMRPVARLKALDIGAIGPSIGADKGEKLEKVSKPSNIALRAAIFCYSAFIAFMEVQMNRTIDTDTVKKLREMYAEDEAARRLFDWLAGRQNDANETSVDRAAWMTGNNAQEMVRVFRELEQARCGHLILGRKGWKTRFKWNYSVRSLGEAAKGETTKLDTIDVNNIEVSEDMLEAAPVSDAGRVTYSFPLRPDFVLSVELPADFRTSDVERLAKWLQSLAFD